MKKSTIFLVATCFLLTFYPANCKASEITASSSIVVVKPINPAQAEALVLRLNQINSMDKSDMKAIDKRELRKEVRTIKKTLADYNGGLYLSVGTIIIILLLLIILL